MWEGEYKKEYRQNQEGLDLLLNAGIQLESIKLQVIPRGRWKREGRGKPRCGWGTRNFEEEQWFESEWTIRKQGWGGESGGEGGNTRKRYGSKKVERERL